MTAIQIWTLVLVFVAGGINALVAKFQTGALRSEVHALIKKGPIPVPVKGLPMIPIVLIDATNGAKTANGESLTPALLEKAAEAMDVFMNAHYSSVNGGVYSVRAGSDAKDVRSGERVFHIGATLPGVPGAIAYHDSDGKGLPVFFDGITLSDSLFGPGNSWLVAMTHETAEGGGNPGVNLWADMLNGKQLAREACDAVESQSFPMTLKDGSIVYVSNFLILDRFFTPNCEPPYDYMTLRGWSTDGPKAAGETVAARGANYQIEEDAGSGEQQVMARRVGDTWRPEAKAHWSSRSSRIIAARAKAKGIAT